MTEVWGYRKHGVDRRFDTKEELIDYLKRMDAETEQNIRYWYISDDVFELKELLRDVADGRFKDVTTDDILDDALDQIAIEFQESDWYDWETDDICGIYYCEEVDG